MNRKMPAMTGKQKKKIYVGLSGGVDSAVSAALLKQAGHDITGVFIKVWQPDWIECNWKEERLEAMRVAAHLEIPFVTLDLEAEYKKDVIDYMIDEYKKGRTPNPDVMCNRYVKFGAFKDWALKQGADAIATGHYARSDLEEVGSQRMPRLLVGVDANKDQSYFLWTLTENDLLHAYFPVGIYTKPEVRDLAKKFKLPNADKKDSQGLCFIGKIDIKQFLSHYIKTEAGKVLNQKGEEIGEHPGAIFFTIGERHGFDLSKNTPNDKPLYVVSKNMETNTITVSEEQPFVGSASSEDTCIISKVNWIREKPSGDGLKARARYRAPLEDISLEEVGDATKDATKTSLATPSRWLIRFKNKGAQTLASGQSLVIYKGEECLGGGIIE